VTLLERLHDRVARLENGSSTPAVQRRAS
jgi:hypothetical protein